MVRVTPSYKRDTLAAIRRIGSFLEPNLLVRDIKPSHLEKYLANRIALHHAVKMNLDGSARFASPPRNWRQWSPEMP